jgi:hypothetical protein
VNIRCIARVELSGLCLIGLGTHLAGDQTEVAVPRTLDAAGAPHETKLWVADLGGRPYVRSGLSQRSWGDRPKTHPDVELIRGGATVPCTATSASELEVQHSVDEAFALKYGWLDEWYGVVLRHAPIPIRLETRGSRPDSRATRWRARCAAARR